MARDLFHQNVKEAVQEEGINLILYNQTDKLITRWIR
jgi:hypothetical protein